MPLAHGQLLPDAGSSVCLVGNGSLAATQHKARAHAVHADVLGSHSLPTRNTLLPMSPASAKLSSDS